MFPFDYVRPDTLENALHAAKDPHARFIGGGTNLLDLIKAGIERPTRLIDVNHLNMSAIDERTEGGLRIGAGARNSDVANHPLVRKQYPLLSQALLAGASAQLRNMATVGGNLMQRTRCDYFVDVGFSHCNKRNPGSGCAARMGDNRLHAILGTSPECVAVNPSDMSVALLALDATVNLRSASGERQIAMADFHRLPGNHPERDANMNPGELIVSVDLPPAQFARSFHYLKVRERTSFAFALVSVAVGLDLDKGIVRAARIALGGVAHRPWLAQKAAALLIGQPIGEIDLDTVAVAAVSGAEPLAHNAYKIPLVKNAIVRAIRCAAEVA